MFKFLAGGSILVSASALLLAGCVVDTSEAGITDGSEDTAEAQSAFASTCGTSGLDYNDSFTNWISGSSSPYHYSGSYETHAMTTPVCADAFVGQYNDVNNSTAPVDASAEWQGVTLTTQALCQNAHIQLATYASDGTLIAFGDVAGVWNPTFSTCAPPHPRQTLYKAGTTNASPRAVAYGYSCGAHCLSSIQQAIRVSAAQRPPG